VLRESPSFTRRVYPACWGVGVAADTGVELAMGAEAEAGGGVGVALATLAGWTIVVLIAGAPTGTLRFLFSIYFI